MGLGEVQETVHCIFWKLLLFVYRNWTEKLYWMSLNSITLLIINIARMGNGESTPQFRPNIAPVPFDNNRLVNTAVNSLALREVRENDQPVCNFSYTTDTSQQVNGRIVGRICGSLTPDLTGTGRWTCTAPNPERYDPYFYPDPIYRYFEIDCRVGQR